MGDLWWPHGGSFHLGSMVKPSGSDVDEYPTYPTEKTGLITHLGSVGWAHQVVFPRKTNHFWTSSRSNIQQCVCVSIQG